MITDILTLLACLLASPLTDWHSYLPACLLTCSPACLRTDKYRTGRLKQTQRTMYICVYIYTNWERDGALVIKSNEQTNDNEKLGGRKGGRFVWFVVRHALRNAIQYIEIQYGITPWNAIQYHTIRYGTTQTQTQCTMGSRDGTYAKHVRWLTTCIRMLLSCSLDTSNILKFIEHDTCRKTMGGQSP